MKTFLEVKEELIKLGFKQADPTDYNGWSGFTFIVFNEEYINHPFIHFLKSEKSSWKFQYESKIGFSYWADGRSTWIPTEITDIATMIVLYK